MMLKRQIRRCIWILLAATALALVLHLNFISQALRGELVLRPDSQTTGSSSSIPHLTLSAAKERFDSQSAVFVDARPRLFYRLGHIPGALSFPREEYEAERNLTPLLQYRSRRLVIYCSGVDCPDSALLAGYLRKEGFERLEIFEGGWPEWQKAGFPVEAGH
ncbi:MAG: rhodanese-like domain-containing protein [Acidobacteriota bacterium]